MLAKFVVKIWRVICFVDKSISLKLLKPIREAPQQWERKTSGLEQIHREAPLSRSQRAYLWRLSEMLICGEYVWVDHWRLSKMLEKLAGYYVQTHHDMKLCYANLTRPVAYAGVINSSGCRLKFCWNPIPTRISLN